MTNDPNTHAGWAAVVLAFFGALIQELHPMSAIGASFGCVFFILLPDPVVEKWTGIIGWLLKLSRKIALTILSWGVGYSVGILFFNNASMLMAILGGALGSAVLGMFNLMIKNDADLPKWLSSLVSAVLRLKGGKADEQ